MKSSFSWPGRPPAEMISRNVERLLTSILDGRPKRGAFCTSTLDGTLKRGAFCTSTLDGRLKRDAFLCTRVGAYCIRPTKRSRKGTGSAKGDQTCDFLSPTGPFGRAYAIRPYHATSKRDAFYTSYLVGSLRRGVFCLFYSSFLALMQEKKQKKIKASGMPAKLTGYMIDGVEAADQVCRVHDRWSRDLSRVCLLFFNCCF